MSTDNQLWGAPRVRDELRLIGHEVAESTVAKYMMKRQDTKRQQTWRTFLANHMDVSAGCDFFTVPTLTFKLLYVFVVLSHDRRRILHVNVTQHPTAEWTAQQLTEAFPGDATLPRYLHRDRDAIYGDLVRRRIAALGMNEVVSAKQAPWQNPYAERVIGSIRRECTDHLIPLNEKHLRKILSEYVDYYNYQQPGTAGRYHVRLLCSLHANCTRIAPIATFSGRSAESGCSNRTWFRLWFRLFA